MEEIVAELIKLGPIGIIAAYFLYNDYQDRKSYREMLKGFGEKVQDHETRICFLEKDNK